MGLVIDLTRCGFRSLSCLFAGYWGSLTKGYERALANPSLLLRLKKGRKNVNPLIIYIIIYIIYIYIIHCKLLLFAVYNQFFFQGILLRTRVNVRIAEVRLVRPKESQQKQRQKKKNRKLTENTRKQETQRKHQNQNQNQTGSFGLLFGPVSETKAHGSDGLLCRKKGVLLGFC